MSQSSFWIWHNVLLVSTILVQLLVIVVFQFRIDDSNHIVVSVSISQQQQQQQQKQQQQRIDIETHDVLSEEEEEEEEDMSVLNKLAYDKRDPIEPPNYHLKDYPGDRGFDKEHNGNDYVSLKNVKKIHNDQHQHQHHGQNEPYDQAMSWTLSFLPTWIGLFLYSVMMFLTTFKEYQRSFDSNTMGTLYRVTFTQLAVMWLSWICTLAFCMLLTEELDNPGAMDHRLIVLPLLVDFFILGVYSVARMYQSSGFSLANDHQSSLYPVYASMDPTSTVGGLFQQKK